MEVGQVQRASRWELARALAERYVRADKIECGRILDTFCEATGYTRKYAIGLLRHPPPEAPRRRRRRARVYGPAEVELLRACWELTDQICGKRLAPFLPELLERLAARRSLPASASVAVVQRVSRMSPATVDRVLGPYRLRLPRHRPSTTAPGALLKGQVPLRTFADWDQTGPGFFEMDLVAHCGWSAAGEFLYTLCVVDVATGWVVCAGLRNKREDTVLAALERLRDDLPFPMLGLDSDNVRQYDRAQTPYRRVLASRILSTARIDELAAEYVALDPVQLKRDIEAAQATLRARAAPLGARARWVTQPAPRSDSYVRQPCPVG